jgi:Zn-dependent protease with chaperone function
MIGFVLCALPGAGARGAPADHCQYARAHGKHVGAEITDTRVISALAAVLEASGFRRDVVVCEISMPRLNATVGRLGGSYYVGITKPVLENFNDAELRAVLGHELAHIVLGHRNRGFELTNHRAAQFEEAADALSAQWLDKTAMQSVLRKLRVDAMALPNASMRDRAIMEIDARIKALQ